MSFGLFSYDCSKAASASEWLPRLCRVMPSRRHAVAEYGMRSVAFWNARAAASASFVPAR